MKAQCDYHAAAGVRCAKQAYKDGLFCKAHTPRKRVGLRLGRGCRMCFATGRDEIGLPCPACKGAARTLVIEDRKERAARVPFNER